MCFLRSTALTLAGNAIRQGDPKRWISSSLLGTMGWASLTLALLTLPVRAEDHLEKLTRPFPETFPQLFVYPNTCNTYVIRSGTAAIVIDPGDGSVFANLNSIDVTQVDWVLLTSHHRENLQGLAPDTPSAPPIALSEKERRLVELPHQFRKWYPNLADEYSVYGASYVRPPSRPLSVARALADGEHFLWRDIDLVCLDTPGNAPGGMSFEWRQTNRRLVFSGAVMHSGSRMTTWFDTEWDYGFAAGIDSLTQSIEHLIERQPEYLCPSQGPTVSSATAELRQYRDRLLQFRQVYIRGYPVFDATNEQRDPISKPTAVPGLSQVTPHLFKLSDAKKGANFAILISDSGRGLVLDCGLLPEAMLDELILGMREHLGLKGIDAFWISHMHGDHFLLGPVLRKKYGAEAWTLDRIVDRCENPRRYDYAALVSAYGDGFDGMKIDRSIADGEAIEWEGYRLQVDWMPGQTEFGCCLWLDIDGKRIAFTGDNLFGTPSDPSQDGHEAVVARNSAIFEEGYAFAADYLLELRPDIVMGSHSFVMPQPQAFLERYQAWSNKIIAAYRELLPDPDYEYRFDPYWVSAYPYRVDLAKADSQEVMITIRNFRDRVQKHRIELVLPPGITAEPAVLEGETAPSSRKQVAVKLSLDRESAPPGLQIVPLDIRLDDTHYGQWFDFLLRTTDDTP